MPERSGNAECSQPVSGALTQGASIVLHLLSKGNSFLFKGFIPTLFSSSSSCKIPPHPSAGFQSFCWEQDGVWGASWWVFPKFLGLVSILVLGFFLGLCLLSTFSTFCPWLWLLRGGSVGLSLPSVPSPCPQKQLLLLAGSAFLAQLVHLLNFSRLRHIPIQKYLPFFLLPYFHLNVKFLLLSFFTAFFPYYVMMESAGAGAGQGYPVIPSDPHPTGHLQTQVCSRC